MYITLVKPAHFHMFCCSKICRQKNLKIKVGLVNQLFLIGTKTVATGCLVTGSCLVQDTHFMEKSRKVCYN